jgi:pimeloyl-ACP methyl ester carboxylesterase
MATRPSRAVTTHSGRTPRVFATCWWASASSEQASSAIRSVVESRCSSPTSTPSAVNGLVLVASGGLGEEVHALLRAATLPGTEFVLPLLAHPRVLDVASVVPRALGRIGLRTGPDLTEMARAYQSLSNADARSAFIHTLRAVIDPRGQRINASDRLYLASMMPTMIIWGCRDRVIPVAHAEPTHEGMPGSTLELIEDAGHFPHLDDPLRFARTREAFFLATEPPRRDTGVMRELVLARDPH